MAVGIGLRRRILGRNGGRSGPVGHRDVDQQGRCPWHWRELGRWHVDDGGKTYPFSVEGLSVADLGVSSVTTSGEVFNLKNVADFSGNFIAGEAGIAIAGGPTDQILKNQNGVVLRLHGTQQGARLTLAAQGVKLTIKK